MKANKTLRKQESERVKAYRKQKSQAGYKNISFVVSPEEYQEIEKARSEMGLTTKELLFYYLRKQFMREGKGYYHTQINDWHEFGIPKGLSPLEYNLRQFEIDQKRGECFQLKTERREKNYLTYVIAEFLYITPDIKDHKNYFPYQISCPNKGYESYEEAIRAYLLKKPKLRKNRQHVLLFQKILDEFEKPYIDDTWYTPVLTLHEVYPHQIEVFDWVVDPIDYVQEYNRIKSELNL